MEDSAFENKWRYLLRFRVKYNEKIGHFPFCVFSIPNLFILSQPV